MEDSQLRDQVDLIRQVFAYIHRFKDGLFVFRLNSKLLEHPCLPQLINDLALLHENGIQIIIVPGARIQIDRVLQAYKIDSRWVDGIRISQEESMPFIKMAAFDVCNQVMTHLASHGKNALIGNWVKARSMGVIDGVDYSYTGRVDKVQIDNLKKALLEGYIPIFPCIGWNESGDAYNISSDELAYSLSAALKCRKLFFMEDQPALNSMTLKLPGDIQREEEGHISKLTIEMAQELLKLNPQAKNLRILNHALKAAQSGVDRVHLINGTTEGAILKEIFSNLGIGTMVFANIYEKIRPINHEDISGVLNLMNPLMEQGLLIRRDHKSMENIMEDTVVYAVDDVVHGTAALHIYEDLQGEIAGLAVDNGYVKLSIGQRLVQYLIDQARKKGLRQVFVLTTQSSDWFQKLGFNLGSPKDLPLSKRENYNRQRNSRVLIYPL
ncbi:MAG: amino-acid N-acetyltransferase [Spirochaetaceae bacterium]|jgi:amino-acid N-acetyltransferase|nr:amino-acid N-acetyltransferase [Spirochaetaceae bacterium]